MILLDKEREFIMRIPFPKRRSVAAAVIAGTLLAGGGLTATSAQAARLGNVSFVAPEANTGPAAAKADMTARDYCNKNFPGKVRAVKQVQRSYLGATTIDFGPTLTFYQYTYECLS